MQKQFTRQHTNMAKGLAILLLLMYHLFESEKLITSLDVIYSPFSLNGFLTLTGFGNVCVSVFVFLTSFGIASGLFAQGKSGGKETLSGQGADAEAISSGPFSLEAAYRQAARRFFRLMGNFAVLYLSVNLLWWHWFDYQSLYGMNKQGILYMLTDALGLSMFFGTPTLNATWWYMEIAYLLIFLVPVLAWAVGKLGYSALLAACFLPHIITFNPDLERYLFVAVFGVCAAYGRWPDRLLCLKLHPALQWIAGAAGFVLCILIRQNSVVHEYYLHLADAPVALFLIYIATALVGRAPLIGKAFAFIGKHAMNIYLVHTFFYMALWQQYIYHFRYAGITFLLLLVSCLLYSVLLESVKKAVKRIGGKWPFSRQKSLSR